MVKSHQEELRASQERIFDERARHAESRGAEAVEHRRVCAVLITYNSVRWLEGCFRGLRAQRPSVPLDVVVVDNGSTDQTLDWLIHSGTPDGMRIVVISRRTNSGYAAACNVGITWALEQAYDFVLVLNPDVELKDGALGELIRVHDLGSAPGPVTAVHVSHTEAKIEAGCHWFMGFSTTLVSDVVARRPLKRFYSSPVISGALMLIHAELIRVVGMFDDLFFFYGEDLDFCRRCRQHGKWPLVALRAHACHWHPTFRGMDSFRRSNFRRARYLLILKKPTRPFVISILAVFARAALDLREFGAGFDEIRRIFSDVSAALSKTPKAFRSRARDLLSSKAQV